ASVYAEMSAAFSAADALADAANRKAHAPRAVADGHGRYHVIEEPTADGFAERLQRVVGDNDTSALWTGDVMTTVGAEAGMRGTIQFFNVDGLDGGGTGAHEYVAEGMRTRSMLQCMIDHRSDRVNAGGRVEYAYKENFGGQNVRFAHSCDENTRRFPSIGECSVITMPELVPGARQRCVRWHCGAPPQGGGG
ncbi:MAG: hypothetical protein VX336_02060, partial [Actinomycetota bacterium]|nr:hypothetical protein [Actinomycetota bacterium]